MQFQELSDKQWKMVQEHLPPLLDVAEKFGVKVEYGSTISDEGGSYNLITNVIKLSQEKEIGRAFCGSQNMKMILLESIW